MQQPSQNWVTAINDFILRLGLTKKPLPAPSGLLALLVTDLAGFTPLVERLGDRRSQQVIRYHNRALRACVDGHDGVEIAHLGDGLLSAFRSVANALRCACAMQVVLAQQRRSNPQAPLHARMGLHAGEPLPEEGRLFGHCVNVSVRVCAQARADSVLVSHLVKELAQGQFEFDSGRNYQLKGVSGPARLYELAWSAAMAEPRLTS
jgi:class 3 adenylate cyclase